MNETVLGVDPRELVSARRFCHAACQWPSKAARANLAAVPDDSQLEVAVTALKFTPPNPVRMSIKFCSKIGRLRNWRFSSRANSTATLSLAVVPVWRIKLAA